MSKREREASIHEGSSRTKKSKQGICEAQLVSCARLNLERIMSFLPPVDLLGCGVFTACRILAALLTHEAPWRSMCVRRWPEIMAVCGKMLLVDATSINYTSFFNSTLTTDGELASQEEMIPLIRWAAAAVRYIRDPLKSTAHIHSSRTGQQTTLRAFQRLLPDKNTPVPDITDEDCASELQQYGLVPHQILPFSRWVFLHLQGLRLCPLFCSNTSSLMLTRGPLNGFHVSFLRSITRTGRDVAQRKPLRCIPFLRRRPTGNYCYVLPRDWGMETSDIAAILNWHPALVNCLRANNMASTNLLDGEWDRLWLVRSSR
jgi:hypothetical protein